MRILDEKRLLELEAVSTQATALKGELDRLADRCCSILQVNRADQYQVDEARSIVDHDVEAATVAARVMIIQANRELQQCGCQAEESFRRTYI